MDLNEIATPIIIGVAAVVAVMLVFLIMGRFLTTVPAGVIRIVSWFKGPIQIYKGPGKAWEVPLLTTASSIPSQAINIDLDITDQTADRDANGIPTPIKVNVQASAIVAVGDTNETILTAANRFFSKSPQDQMGTLTDLLTSAGRRAVNLLMHDQLFSSASAVALAARSAGDDDDEDPLAIIIKRQCSRELHDLGLTFKSLNIKVVNSEVAEARRRQTAMEAKANADIVQAEQERRAQEARLTATRQISDQERELERRRAENAAQIAQAEALKQDALAVQRAAELKATLIAQATAEAEKAKVDAQGRAEAERARLVTIAHGEAERAKVEAAGRAEAERNRLITVAQGEAERARVEAEGRSEAERISLVQVAEGEAERIRLIAAADAERTRVVAAAQAEAIEKVNAAIARSGEAYFKLKQLEMLPQIAPEIGRALAQSRIVNISGDGHAAQGATGQITGVMQTVLAAQLLKDGLDNRPANGSTPEPVAANGAAPVEANGKA